MENTQQEVQWTIRAIRELSKIDQRYERAIRQKVNQLVDFPMVHLDIKHLNGAQYRLRHGDYRIFFEVIDGVPKIIQIQRVLRRTSQTYN